MSHARLTAKIEISENSDYTDPSIVRQFVETLLIDEHFFTVVEADTGPASLNVSELDSVTGLLIANHGDQAVEIGYTSAGGDTNVVDLPADGWVKLPDVDPSVAITLTTASGSSRCWVYVLGT